MFVQIILLCYYDIKLLHILYFDFSAGCIYYSQVQDGKTAVEPKSPQKEGYTFSAWYNGKYVFDFSSSVTESITLMAWWYIIDSTPVTVQFNPNGGIICTTI